MNIYTVLLVAFIVCATSVKVQADPIQSCNLSTDCATCLKNVTCLWCNNPEKCLDYPVKHVFPTSKDCSLSAARWGVCWLNFEALVISLSIIGGVILIAITLCVCKCCGCCCFGKNKYKYQAEELRLDRERQERSAQQNERKQERMRRNDEIRRKYGLTTGGHSQYKQFDNEDYNV